MLQIRVSLPAFQNGLHFTDPIILENVDNISLIKTINTSDESIAFDFPLNDAKAQYINYLRWWECWDTVTNQRVNFGPIANIARTSGETKRISGPGRSARLADLYKSVQTFYYPIDRFFDDLRYENIAGEPRSSTIIQTDTDSPYYGLSKRSKDNIIDEQTGYIAIGRDVPSRGTKKTDSIWAGTGKADYIIIDLGDAFDISKAKILLPWWGGATIHNNRVFDWDVSTSLDNVTYTPQFSEADGVYGRHYDPSPFRDGRILYWGETGFESLTSIVDSANSINARYFKINITNAYAVYNVVTVDSVTGKTDEWDWQCGGSNVFRGDTRTSPTVSTGDLIDKKEIVPSSDCYASVVEVGVYNRIMGRDTISQLAYHQIDGESRQISFYHVPRALETIFAGGGRKYEPGSSFRNISFTCPDGTIVTDDFNTVVYNSSGGDIHLPAYTKFVQFDNPFAQVTYADTWPSLLDAYSYAGSYSWTDVGNDYMTVDFRGVSFKWYATIPADKTPGRVSIEIRQKNNAGLWGSWTTLESSFTLPPAVAGEKVWEITYESGILQDNTNYQIRITNLDDEGFVSIDSFAGYWSASFTNYNEDSDRIGVRHMDYVDQLYDQKFSSGSVYKFNNFSASLSFQVEFTFVGDRLIVYSRKGPNYGIVKIYMSGPTRPVFPGADGDGGLQIDLNSTTEINQAVIFDTNELLDTTDGLPWGEYSVAFDKVGGAEVIWLEGMGVHETSGLSTKFLNTSHLDILKNTAEALQLEWDVTEAGIKILPRLGVDTNEIFSEGRGTTIKIADVEDVSQVATMLVGSGSDIDGLPLTAVTENKTTRQTIGRTIQRLYDLRNVGDYFTLIGAARTELLRRRVPQKRINVSTTDLRTVTYGDSFIVKHPDLETRARAVTITRTQSSSAGTNYELDCVIWPEIT